MSFAERLAVHHDGTSPMRVALDDYRARDNMALVGLLSIRSGAGVGMVSRILVGSDDKPLALVARAADLEWDEYQTIVSERARQLARTPRTVVGALKLYRDTSRERAKGMLGMLASA